MMTRDDIVKTWRLYEGRGMDALVKFAREIEAAMAADLALSHANEDEARRTAAHFKADAGRYRKMRRLMNSGNGLDEATALACLIMETAEQMDAAVDTAVVAG